MQPWHSEQLAFPSFVVPKSVERVVAAVAAAAVAVDAAAVAAVVVAAAAAVDAVECDVGDWLAAQWVWLNQCSTLECCSELE